MLEILFLNSVESFADRLFVTENEKPNTDRHLYRFSGRDRKTETERQIQRKKIKQRDRDRDREKNTNRKRERD